MSFNRVLFSSASNEWSTPQHVYDQLNKEFNFDFDPCPLGGEVDGLARLFQPWDGKSVFVNPPYSNIAPWLERWKDAQTVVYLIPARTDTKWFHGIILPHAKEIRFIKGRLKFGDAKNCAPFPSMIVVFENRRSCTACKGTGAEFPGHPRGEKCEECGGRGTTMKPPVANESTESPT